MNVQHVPIGLGRALLAKQETLLALGLIGLCFLFQARSDGNFFTGLQLRGVGSQAAALGLTALGVTILMIAGEFDLSVSATFATAPIVMGTLITDHGWNPILSMIVGLVVVAAIGVVNGLIVIITGVQSFIVTLAMLFVVTSADRKYLGTFSVELPEKRTTFINLLGGEIPGTRIVAPLIWMLAIAAVLWTLLRCTQYGNWIQSAGYRGGDVGRAMGVPISRMKLGCFTLCSVLAGLAGCLQFANFGLSSLTSGYEYSLLAIVAAVIGGTSLFGTRGTVVGTVVGAVLLAVLSPGLILIGTSGNYYFGLTGVLLILAALANERAGVFVRGLALRIRTAGPLARFGQREKHRG